MMFFRLGKWENTLLLGKIALRISFFGLELGSQIERMSSGSILKKKSFDFAVRIINLYKFLSSNKREYVISKQVLRSGTSMGALAREAEHAESTKDFLHKLNISLKEANETIYWLELLNATGYINKKMFESLFHDASEILKILIASVKTIKGKMNNG